MNAPVHSGPGREALAHAIAHAAHLLPAQRPIESFVHHNTLHAFEALRFEEAVQAAGKRFGARAFLPEATFREAWRSGRILDRDIDAVTAARVPDRPLGVGLPGLSTQQAVGRLMRYLPPDCSGPALAWRLAETDVLKRIPVSLPSDAAERLSRWGRVEALLPKLWAACLAQAKDCAPATPVERPRDRLFQDQGIDPDRLVHPVLIRWCAAFLDHGQSYWPMPAREQGFYRSMLALLAQGGVPLRGWMRPLRSKARALLAGSVDALDCIQQTLDRMGVAESEVESTLTATLLALPGWPGMFVQLKERPDLSPGHPLPAEIEDYLAIRLLLDEAALAGSDALDALPPARPDSRGRQAWRLFHATLLLGVIPGDVKERPDTLDRVDRLLHRWDGTEREALWQLAYERRYRIEVLDATLVHHARTRSQPRARPIAQVITCIDDREESLRRHLEELSPAYETLGTAGFFGVAMAYRGRTDPKPRPLCPAGVIPRHLVEERPHPAHADVWAADQASRRRSGQLGQAQSIGSRTLIRGSLLSLAGLASLVPMVAQLLAPAPYARWTQPPAELPGVLTLERDPENPEKDGYLLGFSLNEMADIVRGQLTAMGRIRNFADLVLVLGHGSSSLNNPHKAAYDCGACGGGAGGPNARALATLANRADVRAALRTTGIDIPDSTWFVGGYHNTANDAVILYDLDKVPARLQDRLAQVRADLEEARRRDAHERCRRFENAAPDITVAEALQHVEDRSEDLAQPRPEYGHATNALCFVGQRDWSRGLYLDRRVFLQSYDSGTDPDTAILERILAVVGPVGAGINLEYYFSMVDRDRYGCNTKLPHNITGLVGVMDGHASDLRTGLPWQMVEIHEPVRLLIVIEASPAQLGAILERQPVLKELVVNRWILVVAFQPQANQMHFFDESGFVPYEPEADRIPSVATSMDWYRGERGHLRPATILSGCPGAAPTEGRVA